MYWTFLSSNKQKREQWQNISRELNITFQTIEKGFTEIQGTVSEIALQKARDAFEFLKKPVIVEDVSLEIDKWEKNPGVYIKYFPNNILPIGSKATFIICVAYMSEKGNETYTTYRARGEICKGKVESGFESVFKLDSNNTILDKLDPEYHPRSIISKILLLKLNK